MASVINEGLRIALLEETPDQSLEVLLAHLGRTLDGERTYIFEKNNEGGDDNTYEWVADGVKPERGNFKMFPLTCARTGIGILVSADISLLRIWKKSGKTPLFSIRY